MPNAFGIPLFRNVIVFWSVSLLSLNNLLCSNEFPLGAHEDALEKNNER